MDGCTLIYYLLLIFCLVFKESQFFQRNIYYENLLVQDF